MNLQVPDYIRSLVPYVPGKPIEETQREFGLKRVIKLASNENPLGPSPKAIAALRKGIGDLHRYPDGSAFHLKGALAEKEGVAREQVIVGNGSNEIIDFLVRVFCLPGDSIVTSKAAFVAYKICAQIHGVNTIEAPVDEEMVVRVDDIVQAVRSNPRAKLVFIANPNNPTGSYIRKEELRRLLREIEAIRDGSTIVALDYAYWEYVTAQDLPDPMELAREFKHVVVLRTFSKVYGLAGLRVGYAIGDATVMALLERVRQPFNLNSLGLAAAQAALTDTAFVRKAIAGNTRAMKFWEKGLTDLGVPYWPSQGNFLLLDVQRGLGRSGGEVFQACLKRGVIFRPVTNYGLPHALRVSMGTDAENKFALKALAAEVELSRPKALKVGVGASQIPKQGFVIAIDGPAGTGKSSVTRRLADVLAFTYVDSGALYRSIAYLLSKSGKKTEATEEDAIRMAKTTDLEFKRIPRKNPSNRIFANGVDITAHIRTPEVSMAASRISSIPGVRAALFGLQRKMGARGQSILEGRDIGTVIFPDADVKFYLTATVEERAKRRLSELEAQGADAPSFNDVKEQISQRDRADMSRAVAPLKQAPDAILIDTSQLTLDEVVARMESVIRERMGRERLAPEKANPERVGKGS